MLACMPEIRRNKSVLDGAAGALGAVAVGCDAGVDAVCAVATDQGISGDSVASNVEASSRSLRREGL
jgi:hypothetical protein